MLWIRGHVQMISDNFLGFLTPSLPLSELVIFPLYWRRHIWAHPPPLHQKCVLPALVFTALQGVSLPFIWCCLRSQIQGSNLSQEMKLLKGKSEATFTLGTPHVGWEKWSRICSKRAWTNDVCSRGRVGVAWNLTNYDEIERTQLGFWRHIFRDPTKPFPALLMWHL